MSGRAEDAEEFRHVFAATAVRVRGFVRRHVDDAECDDVLSEVYLIAWRRFADIPADPLPWLLATARRVLANHWRGRDRRLRRETEARAVAMLASEPDVAGWVVDRTVMLAAIDALDVEDREILLLVGWDGLDAGGVAQVLGCSVGAARMRLSRARQRLEDRVARADGERSGHGGAWVGERS